MPNRPSPKRKEPAARGESVRRRIDETAYRLFSRNGIRNVGVDTIVAESGVAKMTLYRHYATKEGLALSFLRRRTELFSRPWQQDVERRAQAPARLFRRSARVRSTACRAGGVARSQTVNYSADYVLYKR